MSGECDEGANPFVSSHTESKEEKQSAAVSESINTTAVVQQNVRVTSTPNYYQWETLFPELDLLLKNISVIKSELANVPQVC